MLQNALRNDDRQHIDRHRYHLTLHADGFSGILSSVIVRTFAHDSTHERRILRTTGGMLDILRTCITYHARQASTARGRNITSVRFACGHNVEHATIGPAVWVCVYAERGVRRGVGGSREKGKWTGT